MEQRVRFCTTSNGVGIAYAAIGEGRPLVYVNGWPGHLEVGCERPFSRTFLEALAAGVTYVPLRAILAAPQGQGRAMEQQIRFSESFQSGGRVS